MPFVTMVTWNMNNIRNFCGYIPFGFIDQQNRLPVQSQSSQWRKHYAHTPLNSMSHWHSSVRHKRIPFQLSGTISITTRKRTHPSLSEQSIVDHLYLLLQKKTFSNTMSLTWYSITTIHVPEPVGSARPKFPTLDTMSAFTVRRKESQTLFCPAQAFPVPAFRYIIWKSFLPYATTLSFSFVLTTIHLIFIYLMKTYLPAVDVPSREDIEQSGTTSYNYVYEIVVVVWSIVTLPTYIAISFIHFMLSHVWLPFLSFTMASLHVARFSVFLCRLLSMSVSQNPSGVPDRNFHRLPSRRPSRWCSVVRWPCFVRLKGSQSRPTGKQRY